MTTCSVESCSVHAKTRGLCNKHYKRWQRLGDPLAGRDRAQMPRCCTVDGCDSSVKGQGYCSRHYQRFKKYGDPLVVKVSRYDPTCTVPDCEGKHHSGGFCARHCARFRLLGITVEQYVELYEATGGTCAICGKPETQLSGWHGEVMELSIDHDHETGRVRGLLCQWCNQGIGRFRDDPELLTRAAAYLNAAA